MQDKSLGLCTRLLFLGLNGPLFDWRDMHSSTSHSRIYSASCVRLNADFGTALPSCQSLAAHPAIAVQRGDDTGS